jgi:hypothetical protein
LIPPQRKPGDAELVNGGHIFTSLDRARMVKPGIAARTEDNVRVARIVAGAFV